MNQRFHVVMAENQRPITRVPLPEGIKYDSGRYIHTVHEVKQFLEPLGPFAMASVESQAEAEDVLRAGYSFQGQTWYVGGGYVRDEGAVFCLLPYETTNNEFYHKLGLNIKLPNWNDSFKVGKYIKRLWSHHRTFIQGTVISETQDTITVQMDGGPVLTIRYAPNSPITDGMHLVSNTLMNKMGWKAPVGAGLRLTTLSPRGFTKGHGIVIDGLKYDLVLFDNKTMLTSNGRFTLGLDELHPGNLFTDLQSVIHFQMYRASFIEEWAEKYAFGVVDALQDEEKLRSMLRFYQIGFHKWEKDDPEEGHTRGEYIYKERDWGLTRAMRAGVEITKTPALLRKVYNLFARQVMNCYGRVRIPVPTEVGGARYMMVDPYIFDMWGDPTLDGVLKGNEVYLPGHTGPCVFHRQPNAHCSERWHANSTQYAEHANIDHGNFMFISRDVVAKALGTLGGGDQDDRAVYYTDPKVVTHFEGLPVYPIQRIDKKAEPKASANRFAFKLRQPVYDRDQLKVMLSTMKKQRVSIGQAVNPIMFDALITDEKENILSSLNSLPRNTEDEMKRINAATIEMQRYQGYMMAGVASQLETIIDAVKRDGSDVSSVANEIKAFWNWLPVVPQVMMRGGYEGNGRLPEWRRGEHMPVMVKTQLDGVLDKINDMTTELEDYVAQLSWQVVQDIPEEILTYPEEDGDYQLALAIRQYYHEQREHLMSSVPANKSEDRKKAFMKVDANVYHMFKSHPRVLEAFVQLYKIIYSNRRAEAPIGENNRPKPYPDGLLWGPYTSGLTIRAMDAAELTGRYVEAHMYPEAKKYVRGDHDVNIENGVITIQGSNVQVGMIDPIADGETKLEHGLVKVPAQVFNPYIADATQVLTVVAGWTERKDSTPQAIAEWRKHLCEEVFLEPFAYKNEVSGETEHAVRVVLQDGTDYGRITRKDSHHVTQPMIGWLTLGRTPRTMCVTIKETDTRE